MANPATRLNYQKRPRFQKIYATARNPPITGIAASFAIISTPDNASSTAYVTTRPTFSGVGLNIATSTINPKMTLPAMASALNSSAQT